MSTKKQVNLINIEVGNRLSAMRKKKNYSQNEIASGVGLTRTSIVNIEKGRQSLTVETLLKLCAILKCDFEDLLPPPPKAVAKSIKKILKKRVLIEKTLDVNFKW